MPARRAKRRTPARRKRIRKTIVTLKPLSSGKVASEVAASRAAASGSATSGTAASRVATGGTVTGGDNAAQARIQQLEAEIRQLKVQLAEQRNSSTMISAPLAKPERSYKGMAITFAITTILLLVVVLVLS
jgi:hypothetical protein